MGYCATNAVGFLLWFSQWKVILNLKRNLFSIINPILTKLFRSRWLDIGLILFFFCVFLDHDFVSVHKKASLMTYLYEKSSLPMWGKYVNQRLDNDWDIKFCNWWSMWHFSLLFGLIFRVLPQMQKGMQIKLLLLLLLIALIATGAYPNYGMDWLRLLQFYLDGILGP